MAAPAEDGFAISTSRHAGVLSAAAAWPASAKLLAVSADTVAAQWHPASLLQQTIAVAPELQF